jgi:AcrR family transcriptional regulator
MSAPRSRREERKEETRRELLDSAAEVFAADGYAGASLERIARRARFTTGAIYWHFGGKDDLFLAVFEEYALTRVGELSDVHAGELEGLAARGRALADQWMRRQAEDPRMVVATLEFAAHAIRVPRLREALATRLAAVRLAVGRMIEQDAREAGVALPMPAQQLATVLRELGVGLAIAQLVDPDAVPERLYGDFVETYYGLVSSAARTTKEIET